MSPAAGGIWVIAGTAAPPVVRVNLARNASKPPPPGLLCTAPTAGNEDDAVIPAKYVLPDESTVTDVPAPMYGPPICVLKTSPVPDGVSLVMKIPPGPPA